MDMTEPRHGDRERDGFVSAEPPQEGEADLAAPVGSEEFDRAQEEVMIEGAAEAATETEGIAADPEALDHDDD
jgi:hypothetical protein